ncbi:hypothetical protein [Thermophagus xiamenensis]|uniref:Uncharacterized protein n=1 Tax=Thermophagus xiamenensis TaxID=385682 RepID=A0A1I2CF66_9BACT|nr:hypothetical protein [Thermophagus xiamenensis]SFE67009.1 hypothetical protein SAMN05444380_1165 [Thermophagus xiamenensis]
MKKKEQDLFVESLMNQLTHPPHYGGSAALDEKIMTAIQNQNSYTFSPYLRQLVGWAAMVMFVINISLFFYKDPANSYIDDQEIEQILENYQLTSASDWQNYFSVDELETTITNEE